MFDWKPKKQIFKPTSFIPKQESIAKPVSFIPVHFYSGYKRGYLDIDNDGVPDWKDCKPFDKTRQDLSREELYSQKFAQKKNRGFGKTGERVLDIGAGIQPDIRATHAIDLQNPYYTWEDIEYQHGIDLNTSNLPYHNNFFDRVISYAGFGMNFGELKTAQEIYRVLRKGGIVEVGMPIDYEMNIPPLTEDLEKVGFTHITARKHRTPEGGQFTVITARK